MDIQTLRDFVIDVYERENVQRMKTSGNELVGLFTPYFEFIHANFDEFSKEWNNSNNNILKTFVSSYQRHYIDGEKVFTHESVSIDCSFLMTMLFSLYH